MARMHSKSSIVIQEMMLDHQLIVQSSYTITESSYWYTLYTRSSNMMLDC